MTPGRWFGLSLMLLVTCLVVGWLIAPDRVPLHYGPDGDADRVGSRTRWLVESGVVGVVVAGLFAGLARWLPRFPVSVMNVPHKDYWFRPENRPRVRRMLAEDLLRVGAGAVTLMSVLFFSEVVDARRGDFSLSWVFWVVTGSFLAGVLVWVFAVVPRRYAPDE